MSIYHATKTIFKIDQFIKNDQGSNYRKLLKKTINNANDVYSPDNFPFREHLGASVIGDKCKRKLWYHFRWCTLTEHSGRLLRLFNRGHLEEARFIAMLEAIGAKLYTQDHKGNQFRINAEGGHFGGSCDAIALNIPDCDYSVPVLCEFKTSSEKYFTKLKKFGMMKEKFEHYVQMQIYMRKLAVNVGLYLVVNKNTDELYGEIIPLNSQLADEYIDRAVQIIRAKTPPNRINESPSSYQCRFCDHAKVCHFKTPPHRNCRTCKNSLARKDGKWYCNLITEYPRVLSRQQQFDGCEKYDRSF